MKTYAIALVLAALMALPGLASAESALFNRYLQKGDTGSDVLLLQKVLNTDPETAITGSGDGSAGRETKYFGELTKQGVIKLQKKNNLGNKYGFFTLYSGALDDKTRSFLNGEVEEAQTATSTPGTPQQEKLNEIYRSTNIAATAPFIQSITPNKIKNGDFITISGRNFSTSTKNTVRMTHNTASATSTDGKTIRVKVDSNLQKMFDKEAEDLDDDEKDNVKEKMGDIPLFITVQTANGVSNPYQIYFNIK